MKLSYPVKPWIVTQAHGIKNPSYNQFGFSEHNGVDVALGTDGKIYAPCDLEVLEIGFNNGAGNYVRLFSPEKLTVDGIQCYVGIMAMHLLRATCKEGQKLKIGDEIGFAGNTGFSTGPHTHFTFRRYSKKVWNKKFQLDTDKEADHTFDPSPYWTGKYAVDNSQPMGVSYEEALANLRKSLPKGFILSTAEWLLRRKYGK